MEKISRREALGAALAGAAGFAQEQNAPEEAIRIEEIAAADRLAGRSYTESERKLMAGRLARVRTNLRALRAVDLEENTGPAFLFDPRLPDTRIPTGRSGFQMSRASAPSYSGNPDSLAFLPAVELSRLLKARRVTSIELTRMYLDRLKRYGPALHNVVTLTEERALEQAARADREIAAGQYRGPLHGIPYGLKDLFATRGIRTTYGAKPFKDQILDYDATVVSRLEEAGAVLAAKLSMGELAMGDVWFGGLTRTPWNPERGSSGSSAGPGSATAAGLVGFSIGTETLGSIVSPCVVNGVTGLRPTFGRVSRHGVMALSWTMDKIGPMCRGVEDCAMVFHAIFGPDGRDRTVVDAPFRWDPRTRLTDLRVGIDTTAFEQVQRSESRRPIYQEAVQVLRDLGIALKPITLPRMTPAYQALAGTTIDVESAAAFQKLTASGRLDELVQQKEGSWPNTFRVGSTVPAADYLQAQRVRMKLMQEMADSLRDVDLYVTVPHAGPTIYYTNLTGHPTLITRCGLVESQPQMIEFVGALYREDAILRVGHAFEQATTHHNRWPDLSGITT